MSSPTESVTRGGLLSGIWQRRWRQWLRRRLPPAPEVVLLQRRLFIFPSLAGLVFLGMLLVMLIAAINYQNNMAYALTFLLGSVFVVTVHHTFANLHRLRLRAVDRDAVYPGQQASFKVSITAPAKRHYFGLRMGFQHADTVFNVPPGQSVTVPLYHSVGERGWYMPGQFLLETRYPLGLLRCWTWVDLDLRALVYPKPISPPVCHRQGEAKSEGTVPIATGGDEIAAFRDYRPGDSLRAVNWRSWAKGQALTTKVFGEPQGEDLWLDFSAFPSGSTELRLSWLCAQVLGAHRDDHVWGLRLPGVEMPPARGDRHRDACLRALALFGRERNP